MVEAVDAPAAAERSALEQWLLREHLPTGTCNGPAAMCVVFRPQPFPEGALSFVAGVSISNPTSL